jgi:cytochrome oxidase Cu insertion factor (SCO1/SenC/PrrC family)
VESRPDRRAVRFDRPQASSVRTRIFAAKLLLIYFGYSYCPDVCPTDLQQIGLAVDGLGAGADAVRQLFITLDPERDTAVHLNASKEKGRREKTPSCLPRGPRTHSRPIDGRPLGVSAQ